MFDPTSAFSQIPSYESTHPGRALPDVDGGLIFASPSTFNSTLSPSLLSDLRRFVDDPGLTDMLAVVAACVRHARPLALHVGNGNNISVLSVFPREQLFQCYLELQALSTEQFACLRLLHVEPEYPLLAGEINPESMRSGRLEPLGPFLWRLAMHGANSELLPEISGPTHYRLSMGVRLDRLPIDPRALPLLQTLRRRPVSLDELVKSTDLGGAWVRRLLNALYLQSGLMLTRSIPSPWFGRPRQTVE
ncbi:MAG: hypothetical protein ABL916_17495 [Burkholderiaceae bacterium]